MSKYYNNEIKDNMIKYIQSISENPETFIYHVKRIFSIKDLCCVLNINRNRYNYLLKHEQLDDTILTLKIKIWGE